MSPLISLGKYKTMDKSGYFGLTLTCFHQNLLSYKWSISLALRTLSVLGRLSSCSKFCRFGPIAPPGSLSSCVSCAWRDVFPWPKHVSLGTNTKKLGMQKLETWIPACLLQPGATSHWYGNQKAVLSAWDSGGEVNQPRFV